MGGKCIQNPEAHISQTAERMPQDMKLGANDIGNLTSYIKSRSLNEGFFSLLREFYMKLYYRSVLLIMRKLLALFYELSKQITLFSPARLLNVNSRQVFLIYSHI